MGKLRNNESGFGVVEAALVLVVLILLGVSGWAIYRQQHKATPAVKTTRTTSTAKAAVPRAPEVPTNPYAGWKSYCSSYGGLCFKYPASWVFEKKTYAPGTAPSQEVDTISSPSGDTVVTYDPQSFAPFGESVTVHVVSVKSAPADGLEVVGLVQEVSSGGSTQFDADYFVTAKSHAYACSPHTPFAPGAVIKSSCEPGGGLYGFENPNTPSFKGYQTLDVSQKNAGQGTFDNLAEAQAWFDSSEIQTAGKILGSVSYD